MKYEDCQREKESVSVTFERFKVDNKPVCMSWAGTKGHPQEACKFLGSRSYGTKPVCMLNGEDLFLSNQGLIMPHGACVLWMDRFNGDRNG